MAVTTTATKIIKRALRLIGAMDVGETPDSTEMNDALQTLNEMIMDWQNRGIYIQQQHEAVLYFTDEQAKYTLGSDHAALHGSTTNKTELSTAGVATDLTIEVDSITGLTNGDVIGIELDDGTIQWTTINGVPAGTTVTITAALTSAAAVNNHVYAYTTLMAKPLDIWNPRLVSGSSDNESPITMTSRYEFFDIPDKTTAGAVSQVYYDPKVSGYNLYVNQPPDDVKDRLNFTAGVVLTEFTDLTSSPTFPSEWFVALNYNLAYMLAPEYGTIGLQERVLLLQDAERFLSTAEFAHSDMAPVYLQPEEY